MGDGKRQRAAARLDIARLAANNNSASVKTAEVVQWLKRKTLKDMGVLVNEADMFADTINDLMDINSMWGDAQARKR